MILADTHWGKSEAFQRAGIPVPSTVLSSDLCEISELVRQADAKRILILGDLLHNSQRLPTNVTQELETWRDGLDLPILSIRGNHDAKAKDFPEHWQITWHDGPFYEGPFSFRHEPMSSQGYYTFAGHVHPVLHVGRSMRLPCFLIGKDLGILPSFGTFTGGHPVRPNAQDEVYVVSEGEVFCISH